MDDQSPSPTKEKHHQQPSPSFSGTILGGPPSLNSSGGSSLASTPKRKFTDSLEGNEMHDSSNESSSSAEECLSLFFSHLTSFLDFGSN